jgi:hypothetical protein
MLCFVETPNFSGDGRKTRDHIFSNRLLQMSVIDAMNAGIAIFIRLFLQLVHVGSEVTMTDLNLDPGCSWKDYFVYQYRKAYHHQSFYRTACITY